MAIFAIIGLAMIVGGLVMWFVNMQPFASAVISLIFGTAINDAVVWTANNLELIIPLGVFLLLAAPNPKQLGIAAIFSAAIGVVMFLWGF